MISTRGLGRRAGLERNHFFDFKQWAARGELHDAMLDNAMLNDIAKNDDAGREARGRRYCRLHILPTREPPRAIIAHNWQQTEALLNEDKIVFTQKRVVVTGGAGFIGAHLSRQLVGLGAKVRVVDNWSVGLQKPSRTSLIA